ncbi:tripartite motif-containing protein 3-like isoform X3 [Photinus pyralis]|uniref:RING-type domain-containing protein n=2 Tax=Photinus pyralis TaxID=7054 RepID=A0A1Y1MW86_PHOPY|nr:tripartite motif-containing protein 3-like isoform X3 [Photinus pyralis]
MEALRLAIQTRLGERMSSMSSTLVETVSINYEDFNESFLTCGTCLCMYDGNEHTPKLLQCSHTVCLHCLTRIAASQTRDTGSFRCPICRELITIPRGGVQALPPSFLVNQLLDLMSRQRREVIPKCSVHLNQELLFCETCDTVFCTICTGGSHNDSTSTCAEHTIIPFSIAIKRMSEILLYKANECISKLSQAQEGVAKELQRLNDSKEACLEKVNSTFQQLQMMLDKRRQDMVAAVEGLCAEKRKVLEEQHSLIEAEKNKVEQECQGLQYQVEVRNITQRIESLSEKLDAATNLGEPRENSFLSCDFTHNDCFSTIDRNLNDLGRVRTSTTFPSLCTAHIDDEAVAGIEAVVTLSTVDYHGDLRRTGGDPVQAEVLAVEPEGSPVPLSIKVTDCDDGTYKLYFRPPKPGRYGIKIEVFERPIKDNPLYFDVTEHNNPIQVYGGRGSGKDEFMQPVSVAIDDMDQLVYVLDTGNSRIKVLNYDLEFIKHITNEGLNGRSCTGIAVSNHGLVVVNWRTKAVTEMTILGQTLKSFTYNAFQEPIDVAVDKNYGHILVADNGMRCVFVFDAEGKMLFQVGKKGLFNLISSVAVGVTSEIVVADSRIQVFSAKGDFLEVVYDEGKGKGRYGGIVLDSENRILASRSEQKGRNYLQVLSLTDSALNNILDSNESKLKRPSGIAVTSDNHVIVVDLGNNCIKKYRYW